MKFDLMIFDFDGTIADTGDGIIAALACTFEKFNCTVPSIEDMRLSIGAPLLMVLSKLGIKENDISAAREYYREVYNRDVLKTIRLFPGVEDTLKSLKCAGIRLSIASNKGRNGILQILDHFKMTDLFSFIAGEQDVVNKKPSPDMADLIMKNLGIPPDKTLVVGDTVFDVGMGKNAGCSTCAVNYGYGDLTSLKMAQPEYIIKSFSELADFY